MSIAEGKFFINLNEKYIGRTRKEGLSFGRGKAILLNKDKINSFFEKESLNILALNRNHFCLARVSFF